MRLDVIVRSLKSPPPPSGRLTGSLAFERSFKGPSITGATDDEMAQRCLSGLILSLVKALQEGPLTDVRLTVLATAEDATRTLPLRQLLERCPFPATIAVHGEDGVDVRNPYAYGRDRLRGDAPFGGDSVQPELIYFVEPDCLHGKDSLTEMVREYLRLTRAVGGDVTLTPFDDGALYQTPTASMILAGEHRYFRTVTQAGRTLMLSRQVLDRFWEVFCHDAARPELAEHVNRSRNSPLNHLHRIIPCFSPMPALAVAAASEASPPFAPWPIWWEYAALGGEGGAMPPFAMMSDRVAPPFCG